MPFACIVSASRSMKPYVNGMTMSTTMASRGCGNGGLRSASSKRSMSGPRLSVAISGPASSTAKRPSSVVVGPPPVVMLRMSSGHFSRTMPRISRYTSGSSVQFVKLPGSRPWMCTTVAPAS